MKALICRQTEDLAPRLHNLVRLAERANIQPDAETLDTLADLNSFNIEGRYPDLYLPLPSFAEAKVYQKRAEELFQWLLSQLAE